MSNFGLLRSAGAELVPLAHRVRHMELFRVVAVMVTLAVVMLDVGASGDMLGWLGAASGAYVGTSLVCGWIWRRLRRRGLLLFGAMLLIDGVYLNWVTFQTGGADSAVGYVILLHLIAVALLASYRTSLKLALWHSLLALLLFHAQDLGIVGRGGVGVLTASTQQQLQTFIVMCWLVTLVTASFSAVNERQLRRRRLDLEALASFAGELDAAADPNEVASSLLHHVIDVFGFRRGVLVASRSGSPQVIAQQGCAFTTAGVIGDHPGSLVARARRGKATLLAAGIDAAADPWLEARMPGAVNLVVVPLPGKDHEVGVLICEHDLRSGSRIEQRVVAMVERFAAHAALALQNGWLLEDVTRAAETDGLTGIRNRRSFDELLEKGINRSAVGGEPLSLLLLDIDHFKRLNDTLGHQAGDEVLIEVGAALTANCRAFDVAARYGGEEFAVILPGCPATDARELADRIRRAATADVTCATITASAGVATYPDDAGGPEALVAAADAALYGAKHAGRDRLVTAGEAGRGPTADFLLGIPA